MRSVFLTLLVFAAFVLPQRADTQSLTYSQLVNRLLDLEALSVLPASGERCLQASSYDRASRYDAMSDRYLQWDANGDSNGIIREEGGRQVLAEMDGPGVIWRIWSANPGDGNVSIYLDGEATAQVEMPFKSLFDGRSEPFNWPSLCYVAARGNNCYLPMPFQRSCKIVADSDWGSYYHVTWTRYPNTVIVPTFTSALVRSHRADLQRVDDWLRSRLGTDPHPARAGERILTKKVDAAPGASVLLAAPEGAGAITAIRFKPDASSRSEVSLRSAVLRITWDGASQPSVWSPVGDFFGSGPGWNPHRTLPVGVHDGTMYAFWYMPFRAGARVELVNDGGASFRGEATIHVAPLSGPVESYGRFHAWWHRGAKPHAHPDRAIDWPMLRTKGHGRYVGVMLEVWNPKGEWWGEGDEKLHVDDERFPSIFGTGSEDYFGYAWGDPTPFHKPYHAQTRNDDDNTGHISVSRWHITDNVPFMKSFDGFIEKYFSDSRPTRYAALACWYQRSVTPLAYQPVGAAQRIFYDRAADMRPSTDTPDTPETSTDTPQESLDTAQAIVLEGEQLRVLEVSEGAIEVQQMDEFTQASGGAQAWWIGASAGAVASWEIPAPKAGKYQVVLALTRGNDYATVQPLVNGATAGRPVDLYLQEGWDVTTANLGAHQLRAGANRLTIRITGKNAAGMGSLVGLDTVTLIPYR